MTFEKILSETTPEGVLVLTLNDPATRNAAGGQLQGEFLSELNRLESDPALRVLVITGAGTAFCSGANMREMARSLDDGSWGASPDPESPPNAWAELDPVYHDREVPPSWAGPDIVRRLHNLRKPSFAAVNGPALGFGCGVALSCDFRAAGKSASFSEMFIRRGLVPADGSAWQLPKLVGMSQALWMHYSGDAVGGEEAYRIGLANWLFEDHVLLERTLELATRLAKGPVFAMGIAKLLVHEAYQEDLAKHLHLSARAQELTKRTPEHREGMRAFIEKREPGSPNERADGRGDSQVKVVGYYGESWLGDIPRQVREAEALGLDAISAAEIKHNSILALTLAAEHTERIEVGTGVTIAFPRSPMVIAQEAWDLQEFSKGRINIGLGTQVKGHNQRRFSVPWVPPYQRMKDYVGMMRAVWHTWQTGERPDYASENYTFTLMPPYFNPGPLPYPFPKITLGALGTKMAELAGEVADVLIPHGFITKEYLRDVLVPAAEIGVRRAGRDRKDLEISMSGFFALGETQSDVERAIDRNRRHLSFYGSTRTYHAVFRHHEREALGMQLHGMSLRGEWDKMAETVPFNVAAEMSIACTYDDLPGYIRTHYPFAARVSMAEMQREGGAWFFDDRDVTRPCTMADR